MCSSVGNASPNAFQGLIGLEPVQDSCYIWAVGTIRAAMIRWQLVVLGVTLAGILPEVTAVAADTPASSLPLNILHVTPEGENIPSGQQVVISFNRPVVPIGRMERTAEELPITINPLLPCEWRWLNTSALSCNLPEKNPLALATHYSVEIKPGIKAEDGATLSETYKSEFTTARPAIIQKSFHLWRAPGLPVIRLVFNQPVTKESVEQHVFMLAVGGDHHYFRPATNAHVTLKAYPDQDERAVSGVVPLHDRKLFALLPKILQKSADQLTETASGEARTVWLVEPESEMQLDTHVILKAEDGLKSSIGPVPGEKDDDVVEFDTFPKFAFLGVRCISNANTPVQFLTEEGASQAKDNDTQAGAQISVRKHRYVNMLHNDAAAPTDTVNAGKCDPLETINLMFNSPVERDDMLKSLHFEPPVKGWEKPVEADDDVPEAEDGGQNGYQNISWMLRGSHDKGQMYEVYLPQGLKADEKYLIESKSTSMGFLARLWHTAASWVHPRQSVATKDMFGRTLSVPAEAEFATDHRKPNFILDHHDAVLEKNVDSDVPVYVDNINKIFFDYRLLAGKADAETNTLTRPVANVQDIQFSMPTGMREALGGKSGAVYGHFRTDPNVLPPDYANRLFAEVTPYQAHLKLGHFSSIAWVTDLATGAPVKKAKVTLYDDSFTVGTPEIKDVLATATTDDSGVAILPGTEKVDPTLGLSSQYNDESVQMFMHVEKNGDIALLPLTNAFMIDSYRSSGGDIYPANKKRYGHMQAWGMTAQGIYRAGDTMQYKIYVRNQDNDHFVAPLLKSYDLKIYDSMGKKVDEVKDITLSEYGSYSGEYIIPKKAAVGWYTFRLSASFGDKQDDTQENVDNSDGGDNGGQQDSNLGTGHWVPMRVLVSDFTPAPFKVSGQLSGDHFTSGQQVENTTHAELHSGGPYTKASVRITAMLQSQPFVSKNPLAQGFTFDSFENEQETQQVFQKIDMLDDRGEFRQSFSLGTPNVVYGSLVVESAVQDERGKYIAGSAHADYTGVDRLVGLRSTEWLYKAGTSAHIQYLVVDERGNPAVGTDVHIAVEHAETKAARVKSAGNAYLTEYNTTWEQVAECKGTSVASAEDCEFTPKDAGSYRVTASIKDTKGNAHSTKLSTYALGSSFVVWGDQGDTSLTIIPEKTDYKIGDIARFMIKNPYPGAQALISVERYGVLGHFTQILTGSTPVIEVPIKPDYVPGFYLSVTVMSPRVDKPVQGQVDLGKPAMRMGYVTVPIKDPYKQITVTAKTDAAVYKPRDKVTVTLHAIPRNNTDDAPVEIAAVVLDESVFDLIAKGKEAFDPYNGFYKLDNIDLRNYSLLLRLVGRQKFEKKGANPGGDGGHDSVMRSLFKFVSYWNPSIEPDDDGNASFTFEAPDNLTGWRVLLLAATPDDRFGLGEANFKVNRPTEIRPVMPNQVTEGDSFNAGFSVMNRTDKPRDIKVNVKVEGTVETSDPFTQTVTVPAFQRATVLIPVKAAAVPINRAVEEGKIKFIAAASDTNDSDELEHTITVHKQRSLEVAANYATTTDAHAQESIQFPPGIMPDVGSVSVVASASVIGNIVGAFKYLYEYPYICWEQQLTKGVMAAHYTQLKSYLPETFSWPDAESIPQMTLNNAGSFQAPNGGMTYFMAQDQYVDPYLSAYTGLAFNWLRADGYTVPEGVESKLDEYLNNLLRENAVPDFYSEGMSATVRAVALAALAEHGKLNAGEIERYQSHVVKMSLFGKAHFLQAALKVGAKDSIIQDVVRQILTASNQTGGKFMFSETLDDGYLRILDSSLRDNCAILESFTRYAATPKGKQQLSDVPFKLVRFITQSRGSRDYWENTQENMFCMNALVDYSHAYESVPPFYTVTASMDGKPIGTASFKSVRDEAKTLERPIDKNDPGRKTTVEIDKKGDGRLYYSTRLMYALPPAQTHAENAGIEIHREYSVERDGKWELLKNPAKVKRGELVRVDLYVSAPAPRNFVVVDDPVPGGLETVNADLATASKVDAAKGEFKASDGSWWFHFSDWMDYGVSRWSFYHTEMRDYSVRFYSDYLPGGNYHLSYTAPAIAAGDFTTMPAMVQEMYDPDVYGKTEAVTLRISEK